MRRTPWLICCAVIGYVSAGRRPTYPKATPTEMAPPFTTANGLYAQRKWPYRDTFSLGLVPDKQSRWDFGLKGIVHPKMTFLVIICSVPDPDPVSSVEHKRRYVANQTALVPIDFHCFVFLCSQPKQFGFQHSLKYLLCSPEEGKSYRVGMTWGWANHDEILNFEWTIPLSRLEETETAKLRLFFSDITKFAI